MNKIDESRGHRAIGTSFATWITRKMARGENSMETIQAVHAAYSSEAAKGMTHIDAEGFGAVLSRYSASLYRIAFRKLGNAEDAEDALQDGLLSACKNMHQFRGDAQFSTWLGSIVLNSARMQLRRRQYRNFVSLDENQENPEEGNATWAERLEDSSPDAEELLRHTQARENLERVVEMLPVRLRGAFRLRVFEGLSTAEAATALGIREGTLKARFFRARLQVIAMGRQALHSSKTRRAVISKQ
jgi:RNA polymerase sigma-70 factor, ECF subfamily